MLSLRLKLLIAIAALGLSSFAIFGDSFFVWLGLPSGSGRIVVAGLLLVIGVIWFVWSGFSVRKTARQARNRSSRDEL